MKAEIFCPRCGSKLVISEHFEDGEYVIRMKCVACKVKAGTA